MGWVKEEEEERPQLCTPEAPTSPVTPREVWQSLGSSQGRNSRLGCCRGRGVPAEDGGSLTEILELPGCLSPPRSGCNSMVRMGRGEGRKSEPFHGAGMIPPAEEPLPQVLMSRREEELCVWNGSTEPFRGPAANGEHTRQGRVSKAQLKSQLPVRKLGQISEGSCVCPGWGLAS